MSTYARVENGVVVELFTPPSGKAIGQCFHSSLQWVVAPAGVQQGWSYENDTFSPPKTTYPTIQQLASAMLSKGCQITSTATPALNGTYATDQLSQMHIMAIQIGLDAGKGMPGDAATLDYPDANGTIHQFSADDFTNFAAAIRDFVFVLGSVMAGRSEALPEQPKVIS